MDYNSLALVLQMYAYKLNKSTNNSTKVVNVATGNYTTGQNQVRADNFNVLFC